MDVNIIDLSNPLWLETLQRIRHDIYHIPEYLYVESIRTNTIPQAILIRENQKILFLPYLLRNCNSLFVDNFNTADVFDALSPYGYGGFLLSDSAMNSDDFKTNALNQLQDIFHNNHICSVFLRLHPILNNGCEEKFSPNVCQATGVTVSVDLMLSEAEIWQQTRPEHRNHINRCKRAGFNAHIVLFDQSSIDDFIGVYYETMERVNAKETYFFDYEYFVGLTNLSSKIYLGFVELDRKLACAGIFTECCGIVQYHLGGTKNEFLKQAPSKLMFDYVRYWAKERGNQIFHLGGGLGAAQDSLYHFKAGFSKQRHQFLTLRLIVDEERYLHLVNLRAKTLKTQPETLLNSNFFPAYRALT
ncbi:hypothetical protein [Fischerella sp. PCC 9605]|uniref:hypothetical protein n=1 Tax=Fischerella sp. PCC 9605 TaxID=1173024 RepID=UPI00047D7905|nr:hypothetical protein [Fischerella sp. PCC 9605]